MKIIAISLIIITAYSCVKCVINNTSDFLKEQECASEVMYMNSLEDGTPSYKVHADKFFQLGCDPKKYR